MNELQRYLRGLANLTVSALLLMTAIVSPDDTLQLPSDLAQAGWSTETLRLFLLYLALLAVSGLFAVAFWHRRASGRTHSVCAWLNGLAFALLVLPAIYGAIIG